MLRFVTGPYSLLKRIVPVSKARPIAGDRHAGYRVGLGVVAAARGSYFLK